MMNMLDAIHTTQMNDQCLLLDTRTRSLIPCPYDNGVTLQFHSVIVRHLWTHTAVPAPSTSNSGERVHIIVASHCAKLSHTSGCPTTIPTRSMIFTVTATGKSSSKFA